MKLQILWECPVIESCLGSEENRDVQGRCAFGHVGNLCSNCISGWAKTGNGACTNCNTNLWYYIQVVLVLIFQLALIIQAVGTTLDLSKTFKDDKKISLNKATLIRILSNYFQLISFTTGLPITWPNAIKSFNLASIKISSVTENVFTLDCLFPSDQANGVKVVFLKLLITTIGPFILILLGIICTAIYLTIKKIPIF